MRTIMAAAILSVLLALAMTLAVHRPPEPEQTVTPEETSESTPAPVLPIEIIDGEIWVAIPVDGMPINEKEN